MALPDPPPSATRLPGDDLPYALVRAGLLPASRYLEAVGVVRDGVYWRRWGQNALLSLAVGQVLAGILFFFAFNWADLPPFAKLGLIQGGIVLCIAGTWVGRSRRFVLEALLTAAAMLVGIVLAVFGQIYQTGADAYTLFVGWALLILPWVALSGALGPWVLWLAVTGVGGATYAAQIAVPMDWIPPEPVAALLALFYTAALAAREIGARRGIAWLRPRWPRRLLAAVVLGLTYTAAAAVVLDDRPEPAGWLAIAAFAVALAGLGLAGKLWRDLPLVVLAALAGAGFVSVIGVRLAFESGDLVFGSYIVLGAVAGSFGGALALVRRMRAGMTGD